MQVRTNEYVEFIKEILEPFGIGKIRAMFGGYGIYKSDIMFATIIDDELYFKAGPEAAKFFKSLGSQQFEYEAKTRKIKMSYWKVLPEILEDQDKLKTWFDMAYNSALASKKKT